ncbi:acyl-CoA dehydrogenase family protein [Kocuria rhizophila]|nr:acyl-CoA dehydrogenase family protein [Kocuria rhizophila]
MAALATGAAQGCLEEAIRYATEREQLAARSARTRPWAFKDRPDACRLYQARLADLRRRVPHAQGKPFKTEAAIAKPVAGEAAMDNARHATQVFGGYGLSTSSAWPATTATPDPGGGRGHHGGQLTPIARELGL